MQIKYSKSSQFASELLNFKESKTDVYKAIKIILEIDIKKYGTSFDCLMIAEICWEKNKEALYIIYTVKRNNENDINIHLERFGNKKGYKNSLEIVKI